MDRTPLPEAWSVSALQSFLRCPAAYYFGRVLGLEAQEESSAFALGSAVHAAQAFALSRLKATGLPPVGEMQEVFAETFEILAADPRYVFEEGEAERLREDGLGYCAILHASYAGLGSASVIAVEQEFVVPLVDPDTGEELRRPLKGVMDLVLRDADGVIVVADLKTAKTRFGEPRLRSDLQGHLYAYAAERLFGGTGWFRFDVLLKQRKPSLEYHEVRRGPEDYRRAIALVRNVEAAISAGYFAPTAEGGWQCSTCGHRSACRSWHDEPLPVAATVGRAVA
jgi:RecB family exonuclease